MRTGLSIVELVIIAAIIGILAALLVPSLSRQTTEAKEVTARDNLRILRSVIELYAARHGGTAPGYPNNDSSAEPTGADFRSQMTSVEGYLRKVPRNPFNGLDTVLIVGKGETFPADATGAYGWIYRPAVKVIRLDWPGSDDGGIRYFDY